MVFLSTEGGILCFIATSEEGIRNKDQKNGFAPIVETGSSQATNPKIQNPLKRIEIH